ncbi:hypothetical protein MLD38_022207 [Melastoma candidum]|uniref:Uncharacterized protein n=1 Tax=Melastoma candidum TaxID=119954 RepID=A0ACB9QMF6_9MYRT|nr:hypothetical protein MLD38_022207 [Melastoma candidum]
MKVSVKSKKERLKKLSSVGRKNWRSGEMGRTVVCHNNDDGEGEGRKRLKLSRKLLNGCNVAGKATVPRKLRTDLKKPSLLTHEDESPEQNGVKKFKRDVVLNLSPGKSLSGPMTKDEQEVAEVLFAMASMFPDSGSDQDAHCRHVSAQTDQLVLSDAMEGSIKAEGMEPVSDLSLHSMKKEALSISGNKRKHGEETKVFIPSKEPVINKINLQDKQSSEEPAKQEEPSAGSRFRSERLSPVGLYPQLSYPNFVKGVADKALPAWSIGLHMISNGSCNPQVTRIDTTAHSRKLTCKGTSHSKASRNIIARIPWKRCATHVGIGYLIHELKGRDTKDSAKPEMDADVGLRTQASLLRSRTSGLNGVALANTTEVKYEQTFNEFKGGIPCLEMVYKPPQKVYDFLSLSSGKNGIDPNTGGIRTRTANMHGMSSYLSINPVSKQGAHKAMPTTNNHCFTHVNEASAAEPRQVRLQLPILVGSSGLTLPQKDPCVLTNEQQQQRLQQQMLWAATAHRQGLQMKLDYATGMQSSLPMMVPSFPVTLPPKYAAKAPQHHHQQLYSLPRDSSYSSLNGQQDICPPAGVQFYSSALLPHLLCNKQG